MPCTIFSRHPGTSVSTITKLSFLARLPRYQGSMPGGGARGHNLEHLQKVEFLC